jgi:hypothetical protein
MFQDDLLRVTDADTRDRSLTVGAAAANAILARRADDGSNAMVTYTFGPVEPGVYQPVPPAGTNVAFPHWPNVTPFVMTSGSQFRQAGPVRLSSRAWARDYNEVRELGRIDSGVRTADQTHAATFWIENPQFATNTIARTVATAHDKGLWATARAFALVNVAIMEASIATWEAKYYFSFWRPYTAIRGPDERNIRWTRELHAALHPWLEAAVYVNNLGDDDAERIRFAYGANFDRLLAVKAKYDPDNFFRGNQNVAATVAK